MQEGTETYDEAVDPMIGRVLSGLYKVDSRIGEGGMGTVYMAIHVHLGRSFAVKVLSEKVAANKQAVDRLLMEAKAASSIDHDNIVDVVSFDATEDGKVFLVMEMLEGISLADIVEQGPMRLERALPIAYQVCEALHAAHARGIVHRDLKPDNVFIVSKANADFVKVLDFGISKVKTAEAEQVRMTRTGQLVGTPLYMSPEQAKGEADVDRRADIYALGVMLFEMLSGAPPFEGTNYFQLLWKHGNEPAPSLRDRRADLPLPLTETIQRALNKDPADRFQTMAEFEAALMAAAPEVSTHPSRLVSVPPRVLVAPSNDTPLPMPARRVPPLWGAVAAVLLVAGASAAWWIQREEPPMAPVAPPLRVEPVLAEAVAGSADSVAEDSDLVGEQALLPNGEAPPMVANVSIDSVPQGARVTGPDGEALGTTPFTADLSTGEPVALRFTLRGHRPEEAMVTPADGAVVSVELERRRTRSGGNPSLPQHRMDL